MSDEKRFDGLFPDNPPAFPTNPIVNPPESGQMPVFPPTASHLPTNPPEATHPIVNPPNNIGNAPRPSHPIVEPPKVEINPLAEVLSEADVQEPMLAKLGKDLEEAKAGRDVGDIPMNDPYWDAQNKLQKFYANKAK
jgi:hypothetical protein